MDFYLKNCLQTFMILMNFVKTIILNCLLKKVYFLITVPISANSLLETTLKVKG